MRRKRSAKPWFWSSVRIFQMQSLGLKMRAKLLMQTAQTGRTLMLADPQQLKIKKMEPGSVPPSAECA